MKLYKELLSCEKRDGYLCCRTNDGELRIYFLNPFVIRVVTSFDEPYRELSYNLLATAWEDGADAYFGKLRRRISPLSIDLEDAGEEVRVTATDAALSLRIQKSPFAISVLDKEGECRHEDVAGVAYRKDGNLRRHHMGRIMEGDYFFGFGEKTGLMNKYGDRIKMFPSDAMGYDPIHTDPLYKHIPFFIKLNSHTKKAFGYFYHNMSPSEFDLGRGKCNYYPEHFTYTADDGKLDIFFIAGPKVSDVVEHYTDLTGKNAMLPRYALGYLGSSMYYSELEKDSDDAIVEFAKRAGKAGVPMSGFMLSSGYTTQKNNRRCVFTWNYDRFKKPKDFVSKMKSLGVHISANVKPGFLLVHPMREELEQKDFFIHNEAGDGFASGAWWGGEGYFADLTNPKSRGEWSRMLRQNVIDYGIDSIWDDNCEVDSIIDDDARVDAEGVGGRLASYRPVIANIMCKLANENLLDADASRRPFVVCRAGSAGIQAFAQTWAGDNLTCWEALQFNIGTVLGMGLSGVANQGCDIGGFHGEAPEPELFVRWVQNGIFMPRFSIHSCNTDNTVTEPWMYPNVFHEIQDAIRLRYRLLPYLYSLMEYAHETGEPILRPLFYKYQDDTDCYDECVEFLMGDSLLVANVVIKDAEAIEVYLPRGNRFVHLKTGTCYEGGQTIMLSVTLSDIPMFLCEGGILPMAEDVPLLDKQGGDIGFSADDTKGDEARRFEPKRLKVLLFPGIDGGETFYEDDGETMDYAQGIYKKSELSLLGDPTEKVTFQVKREGSYTSHTKEILLEMICQKNSPLSVTIDDGESVSIPQKLYFPDFEKEMDRGCAAWYYDIENKSAKIFYPRPLSDYEVRVDFQVHDLIGM